MHETSHFTEWNYFDWSEFGPKIELKINILNAIEREKQIGY